MLSPSSGWTWSQHGSNTALHSVSTQKTLTWNNTAVNISELTLLHGLRCATLCNTVYQLRARLQRWINKWGRRYISGKMKKFSAQKSHQQRIVLWSEICQFSEDQVWSFAFWTEEQYSQSLTTEKRKQICASVLNFSGSHFNSHMCLNVNSSSLELRDQRWTELLLHFLAYVPWYCALCTNCSRWMNRGQFVCQHVSCPKLPDFYEIWYCWSAL